jgi:hypothetical protein
LLDVVLKFLAKEVNSYLLTRTGSTFGEAEVGRLVDDGGKWVIKDDHLGVSLINIEEERVLKSQLPERTLVDGRHVVVQPQLRLNLHVLFAARFQQYDEALRYLSLILTHFQARPSFTASEYPGLDPRIEKLSVELLSLSYDQLNQLWAFVGGKQLPSVVYKVRMVSLQDSEQMGLQQPLTQLNTVVQAR